MNDTRISNKYKSATHYVLSSLLPYTEANLKLVFLPRRFFSDIAKLEKYKEKQLRNAYYNCIKRGLVDIDENTEQPIITEKGMSKLEIYKPSLLKNSHILVIFDIPESERFKRRQFRALLMQLRFNQIQKSVWSSKYDSRDYLLAEIKRLKLKGAIRIFESLEIS